MIRAAVWFLLLVVSAAVPGFAAERPNVVIILCDDLGYGDVRSFNPEGKIATPHMDRIAGEGMRFTDAHSTSSVCTPTRYSLLTGRYNWRSRLQNGVLGGLSPRLIEPNRMTIASMLRQQGYATACIGKWHLGMDWVRVPGKEISELSIETPEQVDSVDYSRPIANGPNAVGFDYFFGISASLDMVPYTFIENDRVTAAPTARNAFPMNIDKPGGRTRLGPADPDFDAAHVLPKLKEKAIEWIATHAKASSEKPFFLYVPLASPHTPIVPTDKWRGKSGLNAYADFVMETDAAIGEIAAALKEHGIDENTLLIVTSDNGCSPQADIEELKARGHAVSGPFRGHKADIFEGGHRVPFIARWPGKVPAGSSAQLISLVDIMATVAEITGAAVPADAAEDGFSFLGALTGKADAKGRESLVHHSINGAFAIRRGDWKLCFCAGSGGWSAPREPAAKKQGLPEIQLFNLLDDPAETRNLHADHPDRVALLQKELEQIISTGRSTPGPAQKNTVPVKFHPAFPSRN